MGAPLLPVRPLALDAVPPAEETKLEPAEVPLAASNSDIVLFLSSLALLLPSNTSTGRPPNSILDQSSRKAQDAAPTHSHSAGAPKSPQPEQKGHCYSRLLSFLSTTRLLNSRRLSSTPDGPLYHRRCQSPMSRPQPNSICARRRFISVARRAPVIVIAWLLLFRLGLRLIV